MVDDDLSIFGDNLMSWTPVSDDPKIVILILVEFKTWQICLIISIRLLNRGENYEHLYRYNKRV